MRPKLFTARNAILFLIAVTILTGLVRWVQSGMRLPGQGVPSTAGKLVFVSTRNGHPDLWMMDKDGGNAVALMNDAAEDRQPVFSPNGQEVAFTSSNRSGVNPQAYVMDAAPNRKPIYLTSTKTAKSAPFYLEDGEIGFLDTGKLMLHDVIKQETEAVLPHHDLKNILNDFFSGGGLEQVIALDEHDFLAVTNIEEGQAVLFYRYAHDDLNAVQMAVLGIAEKILVAPVPGGGFVVAYNGGGPLPQPFPVLTPELLQAYSSGMAKPMWPPVRPKEGERVITIADKEGAVKGALPVPFPIDSVAMSADGNSVLVGVESDEANNGLYMITPATQDVSKLTALPTRDIALSPDGSTVAFVSGNDIYTVPLTGGDPKNLTNGQGANSAPSWSPAKAKP
jgi:dipeptidyl aminopeptidase/acylaminoacyl peptidase